ncbi:MAG: glycosyltransferase [Alphaproteobacteria bacterium]|nr:glycosyltransferase [Alphaproteobacteria bacterium]
MLDSLESYAPARSDAAHVIPVRLPGAAVEQRRKPHLQLAVFGTWTLLMVLLGPRLLTTLGAAQGAASYIALWYFIVFTSIAWLYGIYNIAVVGFATQYRRKWAPTAAPAPMTSGPPVAMLYTTCNDFVEASAESCVALDYRNYTLYVLDDSSDPLYRARVDAFAARHPGRVQVVRRANRQGFKAGNLNNALQRVAHEPFFAVVDADEILPRNFLSLLVPRMLADPNCGFIQANHRCAADEHNALKYDMRVGIDVHWRWYQPLRNRYGFVMFLGHGALLRRSCWEEIDGFPEIVSEDLGYAIAVREHGYFGQFAEDVVCLEEFPDSVRAFRIRHVKWTRGTCEFLRHWTWRILSARGVSLTEKLDILFPTMNLPLTFFFFLFMINASIVLPALLGETRIMTVELGIANILLPVMLIPEAMNQLFTWDFYLVTVLCLVGPVLCFIADMWRTPIALVRFLAHSTALYASLSPLSAISVIGYAVTGKARFLVTGDKTRGQVAAPASGSARVMRFLDETHPDSIGVRGFEIASAAIFFVAAALSLQIALAGLAIGFFMLPLMHAKGWNYGRLRTIAWLPFLMVAAGIPMGGLGLLGVQPMMFGFGFHF